MFGYTPLDPLVVLLGTGLAAFYLTKNPVRLIPWLPAALSIYFFIPFITLLTLWQIVPLLLTGRFLLRGKIGVAAFAQPVFLFFLVVIIASASYAILAGPDTTRAIIRILYYSGLIAVFSFAYEMGRRIECYELFLKGLVTLGVVLGAYGAYQILAVYTGLPFRAQVYLGGGSAIAFEAGIVRINSLVSEPKRLGYVLFVCGLACFFYGRYRPERTKRLRRTGYGILAISLVTLAGSYFLAIAMFAFVALLLYPSRATKYVFLALAGISFTVVTFPDIGLIEALRFGIERRLAEIEVGIDGTVVYRQEFFAWDYILANPLNALFGEGLGQYFRVLNRVYGEGIGFNENGGLMPVNSNLIELIFDLGAVAAGVFYMSMFALIWRLRTQGETYLCLALLFLVMQSFTIITMHFMVFFAGIAIAKLQNGRTPPPEAA